MKCFNCGCRLDEHDFCTSCGVDVSSYKKIMMISNMYYNEGLERANVRDLSGAVSSLRQSLKFNKNNVKARNLLGLVYFEMGEVIAALSEWVISKNLRPKKNIADDYIDMVQNNGARLDTINQSIKKYNQALQYCYNDSKDLAVIQLKKVLSLNPKFVRAHQLMALLYIDKEDWEGAQRELEQCLKIDTGNLLTLRYMKEVEAILSPDDATGKTTFKKTKSDAIRQTVDNELIIQPAHIHEPKSHALSTILNVVIGLVLGAAAMFFLVLPAAVSREKSSTQEEIRIMSEQKAAAEADNMLYQSQIKQLTEERDDLAAKLESYHSANGTIDGMQRLLDAYTNYMTEGDISVTEELLVGIEDLAEDEEMPVQFTDAYYALFTKVGPAISDRYFEKGNSAYADGKYAEAIEELGRAVKFNPENADAWYVLGHACRKSDAKEEAIVAYQHVVELVPETQRASSAAGYIRDLSK